MAPKRKYRVPISLWLVENSHRTRFVIKWRFFCFLPYQRGPLLRELGFLLEKGGVRGEGRMKRRAGKVRKALTLLMENFYPLFLGERK